MLPRWEKYANPHFLDGIASLCLSPDRVPRLDDVNRFLSPLTGFQAKAVSGYVPAFLFFDCLRNREFPTTITIRRSDQLDYLPEPDIFHDIAGHVPDAHRPALRRHAGALRRMRAHGRGDLVAGIRDEARARANAHQHHQGDGAILLVHHRVRIDGTARRPARLRQRPAELLRRDRARHRIARSAARIRSSSNGRSIRRSRSITISRCCSSSIPSITCSAWWTGWSSG